MGKDLKVWVECDCDGLTVLCCAKELGLQSVGSGPHIGTRGTLGPLGSFKNPDSQTLPLAP